MTEIQAAREASQPIRARTGGSTFANPPGDKAWRLIDAAGCRGLARGGAMVSEKHANFLINTGSATAADIEGARRGGAPARLERAGVRSNGRSGASAGSSRARLLPSRQPRRRHARGEVAAPTAAAPAHSAALTRAPPWLPTW